MSLPKLASDARYRYLNDATFHARVKQAVMAAEAAEVVDPLDGIEFATIAVSMALVILETEVTP